MDSRLEQTYWTLRLGFGLCAFLAGLDKFFDLLVDWEKYLSPLMPIAAEIALPVVGVIEMIAGILLLSGVTRLGGYVVMAWLTLIAINLITTGQFFDIAVRDLLLAAGAFSLARLTEVREETLVRASNRALSHA